MLITESYALQLDDLLRRIGVGLQIPPSQHGLAESRYITIGRWLSSEGSALAVYDPVIYPQGSLRIGTTVRPLARQEFDLDLVCELRADWRLFRPAVRLLDMVEMRISENEVYRDTYERKNRCIRICYANDFHLDILPACPDKLSGGTCLVVPDCEADDWKPSNPKGYAAWFEARAACATLICQKEIEPLPDHEEVDDKPPLKRAVQLLKRWRDIAYEKTPELAPISIVLTTPAALHYDQQDSVYTALVKILDGIIASLPMTGRLQVLNPSNLEEDLSERWDDSPKAYQAFVAGISALRVQLRLLGQQQSIIETAAILEKLFGKELVQKAVTSQAKSIESARSARRLAVAKATGTIVSVAAPNSTPIRSNTFYGD